MKEYRLFLQSVSRPLTFPKERSYDMSATEALS